MVAAGSLLLAPRPAEVSGALPAPPGERLQQGAGASRPPSAPFFFMAGARPWPWLLVASLTEPLPMGATPCSFPLPAPRNCSSSRSSSPAMACDSVSSLLACCCAVPMVLARCSTKCAATPSSSCAAGSLFGGANGQHAVMPPCVRCFAQPRTSSSFTPVRPRRSVFDSASTLFSYD
eukprot:XP_020398851.1 uncharacterized protein LOC103635540 isoform X2 [Zea mays]